jgi:hypothetical protein
VRRKRFALITLLEPILPQRIPFATDQSIDWIAPQMVMIIEVFIGQHQTIDALTKQLLNAMFNIALVPVVDETAA